MNNSEFPTLPEEIQTLLHALRRDGAAGDICAEDWESVVAASEKHLVAPLLYLTVRKNNEVPPSVISRLEANYHTNLKRNIQRLHRLGILLKTLNKEHIPVVVLKGCHLAETVYENVGARIFGDADLLVKPDDMDRAHRCLTKAGAFSQPNDLPIDLHWYLENILNIDMDRIWSRIKESIVGSVSTLVLSPEDLLIHLCLHLGFHHNYEFGALRSLCDIREIISRHDGIIDWGYISETATNSGFPKAIFLPLYLAKMLVSAQVPKNVIASLCPDTIPSEPVKWALSRMFSPKAYKNIPALSPNFWALWASDSFLKKILSLRKLIYPDRNFIAQKYPTPPRSLRTYIYYLIRMKDHLLLYLSAFARIIMNEPEMKRILEKERCNIRMQSWMTDRDTQAAKSRERGAERKKQLKQPFSH
jgi:hypothetical protein